MEKEIWVITRKKEILGYTFSEKACFHYLIENGMDKNIDFYKIENLEK